MDITQLRYFLTVSRHMNYTRAAEELYLSRQALRQSMQTLEHDLGAPLFHNQGNHLSLTASGLALKEKAPAVLEAFDRMEFEIRDFNQQFDDLPVAYSVSILTFLFPALETMLSRFQEDHRRMKLRTQAAENDEIWRLLAEDRIKFGILMAMPRESREFAFVTLQDFRLSLTLSRNHPLAGQERLSLTDLAGLRLMGMGSLSTTFGPLHEALKENHIPVRYESTPDTIDAFYHAKHNLAAIFNVISDPPDLPPYLKSIPLADYHWPLCLVYKKERNLTSAEAFFFKYMKNYLLCNPIVF